MGCSSCGTTKSSAGTNKAYTPAKPKAYNRPSGSSVSGSRSNTFGSPKIKFSGRGK